ncbi:hypothetical protein B7463_g2267, partial [Scytalidium lignicola]
MVFQLDWDQLNSTIGGRLIQTVPLGSPCHDPFYDEAECDSLRQEWNFPTLASQYPSAIDAPYFQNGTCDPFHPISKPCTLGGLVSYSINASSVEHVSAGVEFAQKKNIRLVVKNTGHDYLGKSTGKGALGIWTHHLNSIESFANYTGPTYTGPALKIGAGVQAYAAYDAAHELGYRVVGGTCPTVGLAGGYSQGGGHSMLSSQYGLGADNVLEWEVVTANGTHLVATPAQNADLYWALSGGGPGTYGVVISMTTKMHEESQTGGALLTFNIEPNRTDAFWDAITVLQVGMGPLVDQGMASVFEVTNSSVLAIIIAPNQSTAEVTDELAFITNHLDQQQMPYQLSVSTDATYYDYFVRYFGPLPEGSYQSAQLTGSRLIPRSVLANATSAAAITNAYRDIVANGDWTLGCVAVNASHAVAGNTPAANAVLPAWRTAGIHTIIYSPWDWDAPESAMVAREAHLTNSISPRMEALTPGSGTYLNEANFQQKEFQENFYGANYGRLRSIKKKYDPKDLFYTVTSVGSEAWVLDGEGRLCRP